MIHSANAKTHVRRVETEPDREPRQPVQQEMPFAMVQGEPWATVPKDLYIPPQALEVFLDTFEGPLDLLLYLIKRQNLNILDIPVADITKQYMEYVELMKELRLELAAEYLVMAAMLAEIKSRMLLPRSDSSEEEEDDPRAELVRRLQEYEQFKQAAMDVNALERMGRDNFPVKIEVPDLKLQRLPPPVELGEVLHALREVMQRADLFTHHRIERESLSMRERMSQVLELISGEHFTEFPALFDIGEGRMGVVVTFMAVLELIKSGLIELVQAEAFGIIHVKARIEA